MKKLKRGLVQVIGVSLWYVCPKLYFKHMDNLNATWVKNS